ncbi:ABC transporter permease [Bradyrhizobium sp. U87765 SZCCT0131]|uniref:ABC transporter permease n=1 Tax=unclassified Bradyrhizobium TaxID=2631580 RepID=UPI001BA8CCB4|nr:MULTISPECIES: ABC transporter permease [unclassified Bradyrhizobium]MBR1222158.1 ABC transporter permease [Bradyrhizobium sp. U87765 SZCCT0131]MBR1265713.1 ABC transporter permease [Bradyrhizobium sp. U87765 SZCCT0134]MBR1307859.1 ABC transporter permease [Bradyrhizobium sp. U87765 SZCCT0110]MBR1324031.1 ABC transporter permease [Bradyrhizobium sp. U87765 SZCCT0109]MBR1348279.1 ABC transporter permease [Bradyrhizobium sp. U87765 SZCCT0048]
MTDRTVELPASSATAPAARSRWPRRHAAAIRRVVVLIVLAAAWQIAAILAGNPILLPSFTETARAFADALLHENLASSAQASIAVLLKGYAIAIALAAVLVSLATASALAREALLMLTAMFNPLPAIALLPLAMLWFGLGEASLVFVLVHSVLWPFALATFSGFEGVPETHRLVGRNYGLRGPRYIALILIPSALPAIISGLKIGWAFAWRTLIAAELVFGVSASQGGLGWFIFRNRNELFTDKVFAGLAAVILIGLAVEFGLFRTLEAATVRRWGLQR